MVVAGPTTWNHLIELDSLPEAIPHLEFARRSWWAVGGTSAGKAAHLAGLNARTTLVTPLGADAFGAQASAALARTGATVVPLAGGATESHVNLMTPAGERISLVTAVPCEPSEEDVAAAASAILEADAAFVDLSALGLRLVAEPAVRARSLWVDLHDYDGDSAFHEPFVRVADVVFMNADRTDDPQQLMASCLRRGPRLAVCTLGADGAICLTGDGELFRAPAVPVTVVDTNGAGDAFAAGFMMATLGGAAPGEALTAGARQAAVALSTDALHPALLG